MSNRRTRFARAGRRGAVAGVAVAVFAGASLAPAATAEEAGAGLLLNSVIETITSGSQGQDQGPQVTLSQSVVSEEGEHQITVTGTGFTDDSVVGTRPPLAGVNPGVYVVFGKFAEEWQPSAGVPIGERKSIDTVWAVLAEHVATVSPYGTTIELSPEGSFTAPLTVSKEAADAVADAPEGSRVGIYTYAGSGAKHPAWETFTPISFGEDELSFGSLSLGSLTDLLPN